MSHTPGPWKLEHDWREQPGAIIILSADNQIVADAWAPRIERVANARLIAAAPELLEALKSAVARLDWHEGPDDNADLRAIIAKAEGRP